jgi:ketosteroid isomerase-like protein
MPVELLWHRYAVTWSLDDEARPAQLATCLAADVTYTDPHGTLDGIGALSDYMAAFQHNTPGAAFEIDTVRHHHDRSLATWHLRDAHGTVLATGTSTATHTPDGRLHTITGFFDPAAPA